MKSKLITALAVICAAGVLTAEPKVIDRIAEAKDYPDLQNTEKEQDNNIQDAYKRLTAYAPLVALAAKDRANSFKERAEPLRFEHTFRNVKYTPRNTYVRYVKESDKAPGDVMLVGLGDLKTIEDLIAQKTAQANAAGMPNGEQIAPFKFGNRDGVELTQFQFIIREDADKIRAIGSRRKSVILFYKPAAAATPDTIGAQDLDLVVTRIVEDDYDAGVKDVEVIIDPSPSTPGTNDVITLHRYNYKVTTCAILGTMSNTPNYPHRAAFKQKFYARLMDHFDTLYRMVDTYAKRDGNDVNEKTIDRMNHSMDY
ncbi:MAG TPA: hypothetical protein PKE49_05375 [Leptospiraceae bacterium]|nr:hypothetical protein [Leptospirales bacterium]HMU84479.1 hypothetical protein [Leptospiraceae bacterium]HMX55932.1 hypothetical protein [Leptospiraceae bacterium]HNE24038.1 hypothetical protein [Leptospiraceae bacterium]HNL00923.1 hypothetical protein [Leptospiraceae bacterium]